MVLLALVVLQVCHASGVAGFGSVTNVSRKWCERGALERQTPRKRTIAAYTRGNCDLYDWFKLKNVLRMRA